MEQKYKLCKGVLRLRCPGDSVNALGRCEAARTGCGSIKLSECGELMCGKCVSLRL